MRLNGRDIPTYANAPALAACNKGTDADRGYDRDSAQVRPTPLLTSLANEAKELHNITGSQIDRLEMFSDRLLGQVPTAQDGCDPSALGEAVGYSEAQQLAMLNNSSRQFLDRLHRLADRLDEAA